MQNQILISPFCFSYYAKDDSVPKIQYKNGYISEIIYDPNTQIIFEVLGFSQSNALQIFTIDNSNYFKIKNFKGIWYIFFV